MLDDQLELVKMLIESGRRPMLKNGDESFRVTISSREISGGQRNWEWQNPNVKGRLRMRNSIYPYQFLYTPQFVFEKKLGCNIYGV